MKIFLNLCLGFIFLLLTACGQNVSTLSSSLNDTESGVDVLDSPEIQKISSEVQAVEDRAAEIESEVQKLSQLSAEKIKIKNLKKLVGGFSGYLEQVKKMILELEQRIQQEIIKLDPNNPAQTKLKERLEKALAKLQDLRQSLDAISLNIKGLIEKLFDKIEDRINQTGNPLTQMILKLLLEALKEQVLDRLI